MQVGQSALHAQFNLTYCHARQLIARPCSAVYTEMLLSCKHLHISPGTPSAIPVNYQAASHLSVF